MQPHQKPGLPSPVIIGLSLIALAALLPVAWWLVSPLFVNNVVNEPVPVSQDSATQTPTSAVIEEVQPITTPTTQPDATPTGDSQVDSIVIGLGEFQNGSGNYAAAGVATIYLQPDGSYLLRFENFSVTNGPDLNLILTTLSDPLDGNSPVSVPHLDLGDLKGNQGDQNYLIPAGTDLSQFRNLVIYCVAFSVTFGYAPITPSG